MTGLRWGILATGGIAGAFASDLRTAGLDLVAVGSRSQESADAFAARFDIARAHPSYEALVADPDVDIIYVSTPHPMHHENARLALEHGKHVLVEKAFTLNRAEAEDLQRLAAERGLLVTEAMWTRYLPHMVRIREIIADGTLGEIRAVTRRPHAAAALRSRASAERARARRRRAARPRASTRSRSSGTSSVRPPASAAVARLIETGADAEVATVMTHEGGAISTTPVVVARGRPEHREHHRHEGAHRHRPASGTPRRRSASCCPTAPSLEEYALRRRRAAACSIRRIAAERLVREGLLEGDLLPIAESVAIMGTLDEIRSQIGVRYPSEEADHG